MNKSSLYILTLAFIFTSCGGGGGGGSEPSVPAPQNITVSLTSSADSAEVNSSITLTWSSTLATSCSASGAWSGSKGTSGSESITIGVGGSNTFTLSCSATGANSGSASTTVNGLRYFDGKVFDGYIRGAEVFVDTNDNLTLDANEASVTTDNQGGFTNLLFGNGTLVARGGIDLDTGAELSDLTLVHKLEGYEASKLASPFTTLIAYMSDASNINAALGIDASINLLTTDPIPNLGEGIYDQMYEKGNQLTVLSYTLQNQAAADSSQLYFEAIADQLEESYAANQTAVDIEDPTFISNVINKAETASANTLTPEVKANLNTVLATTIPLLKVYADSNTTASVQRFAFSTLQNDVQDSTVIGSSSSATINQYENNVYEYVATDQGIDEAIINPISNNAPTIGSSATFSAPENQTAIGSISASDADGDSLTYSISGSEINISSSGVLTFASAPDYETKTSYSATVTVSDGTNSATQSITVTITDVDETTPNEAPIINSSASFSAAENQTAIGTISASDADGDSLTYSISGSEINISSSGVLTFATAPDYETKTSYTATVTVSDGTDSVTQAIMVNVTNVNDNTPIITSSSSFYLDENTSGVVGTITASDADGDVIAFSVRGYGAPGSGECSINSSSGELTCGSADYEVQNGGYVYIKVSDGVNESEELTTIFYNNVSDEEPELNVTCTRPNSQLWHPGVGIVNCGAELALSNNQPLTYPENSPTSYSLNDNDATMQLFARDADYENVTFSTGGTDGGSFNLVTSCDDSFNCVGEIFFKSSPDYETKNSYSFTVIVDDGTYQVSSPFNSEYQLSITDVVEAAPNTAPTISSSAIFSAAENQTAIGTISASDADGDSLTYSVSGSEINISSSGVLTFATAPDYETKTSYTATVTVSDGTDSVTQAINVSILDANDNPHNIIGLPDILYGFENSTGIYLSDDPSASGDVVEVANYVVDLDATAGHYYTITGSDTIKVNRSYGTLYFDFMPDYETQPTQYTATVTAHEYDDLHTASKFITVNIIDLNEAPAISSPATFNAAENQTAIGTVIATDVDGDSLTYSISGSEINISSSGVLTFATAPDYETETSYTVTVTVSDGAISTTQSILINVQDINEAPEITSSSIFSMNENETDVGWVQAIDPEGMTFSSHTWSITGDSEVSIVQDMGVARWGKLTINPAPDYESKSIYQATVTLSDGELSTSQDITINIIDIDE